MYLDAVIRGYDFVEVPVNPALREELAGYTLGELASRLLTLKAEIHNRTDLVERPRLVRAIEIAEFERSGRKQAVRGERPDIRPYVLGVRFERSVLRARIRARLEARVAEGLVGEVRSLHEAGADWERLERLGLEYRFAARFLQGKIATDKEFVESLYTAICQFAKRQETWFRGMERRGVRIEWIPDGDRELAAEFAAAALKEKP